MPVLDNIKYEAFARKYVELKDAKAAATAIGIEAEDLGVAGHYLLHRPEVTARVKELTNKLMKSTDISAHRIMLELARLSVSDIRKFYAEDGTQKAVNELDDDAAACVKGFDRNGRFQFHDKNPALNTLAKHFKIVGDEGDGVNALASALADRLKTARKREANQGD